MSPCLDLLQTEMTQSSLSPASQEQMQTWKGGWQLVGIAGRKA